MAPHAKISISLRDMCNKKMLQTKTRPNVLILNCNSEYNNKCQVNLFSCDRESNTSFDVRYKFHSDFSEVYSIQFKLVKTILQCSDEYTAKYLHKETVHPYGKKHSPPHFRNTIESKRLDVTAINKIVLDTIRTLKATPYYISLRRVRSDCPEMAGETLLFVTDRQIECRIYSRNRLHSKFLQYPIKRFLEGIEVKCMIITWDKGDFQLDTLLEDIPKENVLFPDVPTCSDYIHIRRNDSRCILSLRTRCFGSTKQIRFWMFGNDRNQ